jgi:Mga helix-turn-helix domain.
MLDFLEPYLQKKILLSKAVYLYGLQIPQTVVEELDISNSTFKKYSEEIYGKFLAHKTMNGSPYIVDSLKKIIDELIEDSMQIQLLKLLFLYPGERADFYKKELILSDATFSRYIAQLKLHLKSFDIHLLSKSGYIMETKSEWNRLMLFTHLACFYQWDVKELEDWLIAANKAEVLETIKKYQFSSFTFADTLYENEFFYTLVKLAVIRQTQLQSEKNVETVMTYLQEKYQVSQEKVRAHWPVVESQLPVSNMSIDQKTQLMKLLGCAAFQIEIFPSKIDYLPLRHALFADKFTLNYPERSEDIHLFVEKLSRILKIDLTTRYAILFHFLVVTDILAVQSTQTTSIYVYSDLGYAHQNYLFKSVGLVVDSLPQEAQVSVYESDRKTIDDHEWIVTNRILEYLPERRQILVGDYLSAYDYVMLKNFFGRMLP